MPAAGTVCLCLLGYVFWALSVRALNREASARLNVDGLDDYGHTVDVLTG